MDDSVVALLAAATIILIIVLPGALYALDRNEMRLAELAACESAARKLETAPDDAERAGRLRRLKRRADQLRHDFWRLPR